MELSTSAGISAIRTGLQVVSNIKHPQLEVYFEFKRIAEPITVEGVKNYKHSSFIQFYLVNIGGKRAKNIKLNFSGDKTYFIQSLIPNIVYGEIVEQMPPAQVIPIVKIEEDNLFEYIQNKDDPQSSKRGDLKKTSIKLNISYDAPKSFFRSIYKFFMCKERYYQEEFIFRASIFNNSVLPEIEYKG